jgi:hypothetical protein
MLDQSNKKVELLEKVVENLQLSLQNIETTAKLHLPLEFAFSVVHDIALASLSPSWKIIYDFPYSHATTIEELRALKSQCKEQIIVGAVQGSSATRLAIAAMGPSDILLLNNPLNQPTKYGNVHWYLTPKVSFGFAPSTATINCRNADTEQKNNSENRLCWYLLGIGGYRAGAAIKLDKNNEWRKIIMTQKH